MHILVLGYIVRGPLGGLAWHHFQYVLGLKQLGHEVLFLEDSDDFPGCYSPDTFELSINPEYGLKFVQALFDAFDLTLNWAYYDAHTGNWFGQSHRNVRSFCEQADIVLNISGVNPVREWWAGIPIRVLIDTDPGFTQINHLTQPCAKESALQHTHYFSFAENINNPGCTIPADGFPWQPTRQPVYLDTWKAASVLPSANWTTVMQWDSYKPKEFEGRTFGMKSQSFQSFDNLPGLIPGETFELALGSATAPIDDLKVKGWKIISSLVPTRTPWTYQRYIQQSKGEWSIAKHGYVNSISGWFSERSCAYLASGKPVIVQDTGFSKFLPTGEGLFSFLTVEEAVDIMQRVNKNYLQHCKKARCVAEEYFDSIKVLGSLIEKL